MRSLFLVAVLLFTFPAHAGERRVYTYDQLADAIYRAEGGAKATYLYGIRSVSYDSPAEARRICLNTIRNNVKRFKNYGYKDYPNYLEFLASRYCPTTGDLSNAEKKLNKYWLKNVKYFLDKS
jgi:hypothetical protein